MTGFEIGILTYVIGGLQLVLFPIQLINVIIRRSDKSRLRFLILILSFLLLNILWIFYPFFTHFGQDSLQLFFDSSILLTTIYTYHYLRIETGVIELTYKTSNLLLALLVIALLDVIQTKIVFVDQEYIARIVGLALIEVIAVVFGLHLMNVLKKSEREAGILRVVGILSCAVIILLPLLLNTSNSYSFKSFVVNLVFFMMAFGYYHQHIQTLIQESLSRNQNTQVDTLGLTKRHSLIARSQQFEELTSREIEIAQLLLMGYDYKRISNHLCISESTVRKHASNIFKKENVLGIDDLLKKYKSVNI